jgi:hypothetical protein
MFKRVSVTVTNLVRNLKSFQGEVDSPKRGLFDMGGSEADINGCSYWPKRGLFCINLYMASWHVVHM